LQARQVEGVIAFCLMKLIIFFFTYIAKHSTMFLVTFYTENTSFVCMLNINNICYEYSAK